MIPLAITRMARAVAAFFGALGVMLLGLAVEYGSAVWAEDSVIMLVLATIIALAIAR